MRRAAARAIAIAASTLALVAGAAVWQLALKAPAVDPLPLPAHLVSLATTEGRHLLAEGAARADYPSLATTFESQQRPAFCGVASSVMVLNALRPSSPRLTQGGFFRDVSTELQVTFAGMTLHELGGLLRGRGADADVVHAADTTLAAFRLRASQNLGRAGDYVLVNYQRAALGQREGGHISPLAAYHAATDRFLVLDVAAYRYPPVWVPAVDLWNAMNTVDSVSKRTRGFVVVRDAMPRPP